MNIGLVVLRVVVGGLFALGTLHGLASLLPRRRPPAQQERQLREAA